MITNLLLNVVIVIFGIIFAFFPEVNLASIPLVGESLRNTLISVVLYWNSFMDTFPYAQILWSVFLKVVIPFEIVLLIVKFFLGSRAPVKEVN